VRCRTLPEGNRDRFSRWDDKEVRTWPIGHLAVAVHHRPGFCLLIAQLLTRARAHIHLGLPTPEHEVDPHLARDCGLRRCRAGDVAWRTVIVTASSEQAQEEGYSEGSPPRVGEPGHLAAFRGSGGQQRSGAVSTPHKCRRRRSTSARSPRPQHAAFQLDGARSAGWLTAAAHGPAGDFGGHDRGGVLRVASLSFSPSRPMGTAPGR
jgi:hypothetical protein